MEIIYKFYPLVIQQTYLDILILCLTWKSYENLSRNFLNSKKFVTLPANPDRQSHTDNNLANRMDSNLSDRVAKFTERVYRVPLRFLVDIELVNFPVKINSKVICTLETDMNKLFNSNAKVSTIGVLNANIIWYKAPFIQYEQIRLKVSEYLETAIIPKKFFQRGLKNHHTKGLTK